MSRPREGCNYVLVHRAPYIAAKIPSPQGLSGISIRARSYAPSAQLYESALAVTRSGCSTVTRVLE